MVADRLAQLDAEVAAKLNEMKQARLSGLENDLSLWRETEFVPKIRTNCLTPWTAKWRGRLETRSTGLQPNLASRSSPLTPTVTPHSRPLSLSQIHRKWPWCPTIAHPLQGMASTR